MVEFIKEKPASDNAEDAIEVFRLELWIQRIHTQVVELPAAAEVTEKMRKKSER